MRRTLIQCLILVTTFSGTVLLAAGSGRADAPADDVARGKTLYESRCGGCHSLDANRIGPMHRGVVGRAPGTAAGYDYSAAVKKLGGVWTPDRLDTWLQGPQKLAPGAKMFFSVADPADRRAIIGYLASVSPTAQ